MGECYYCAKARFPSLEMAVVAEERAAVLFAHIREMADKYNDMDFDERRSDQLTRDFPKVCEALRLPRNDNSGMPGFSGYLDVPEDDPCAIGDMLYFSGILWHFATLEHICEWLVRECGAVEAGWISEEEADLFACIDMRSAKDFLEEES